MGKVQRLFRKEVGSQAIGDSKWWTHSTKLL